jgi:hypothetical protein
MKSLETCYFTVPCRRLSQSTRVVTALTKIDLYLNQNNQVLEERPGGSFGTNPQYQYVWSPLGGNVMTERDTCSQANGNVLARQTPLQDPLGTVVALWNTAVLQRYVYDPGPAATKALAQ